MGQIKAVIFLIGLTMVVYCSGVPVIEKDNVEPTTTRKVYGDQPIVDTGVFSNWDNPFSRIPSGGLFDSLEGIMEKMRQQISSILNRFPGFGGNNSTEDVLPFAEGLPSSIFPSLDGIDLSKGNTSSITKVIDGHTVVINETEYKNENDFGGTFFKVRIIDVKPDSSEVTTEKEAEAVTDSVESKDREEIANSMENEIVKSKEVETEHADYVLTFNGFEPSNDPYKNIETFDEVATSNPQSTGNQWQDIGTEWENVKPVDTVDSNSIQTETIQEKEYTNQRPIDLSRDTFVNDLLAERGAPIESDAEVFLVEDFKNSRPINKSIDPRR
ncbi:hypothetical protein ABEB36_004406 [Hypothenemus hampei]|uniref:Icarapin-like n=1 Tax=Hypothenemus hampei TaxID=57062 RepID=A0ABD1F3A7_HYPHA